ncbi:hypothetical protein [Hoeflea sp. TYP-13]|uniref:hypothetical protein n=1 Tax=Hoeflea sp. TYP-13 TaxID=3230023 RepID=UPI0034C662AD
MSLFNVAIDLCGLPAGTFDEECDDAWAVLAAHFQQMEVDADRIASSAEFNPQDPEGFPIDDLEQQYPTITVKKILAIAKMMRLAVSPVEGEIFAKLPRPPNSELN